MDSKQLVKERLERYGSSALFDREAVAFLTGIDLDKLESVSSLREIRESAKQLRITKVQSQKLEVLFDLSNRIAKESRRLTKITKPAEMANYLYEEMRYLKQEEFRVVMLDTKNQIIKMETIFKGSLASCIVHPRAIFKEAVLVSAANLIAVHNHPSGDTAPSKEDIEISKRLIEAGNVMGIKVIDSLIIGDNTYTSLKEQEII